MAITQSSGREPWIFRVDRPADLIGSHRELIASAIQPGESTLHLIYSPAWEGSTAPFGITAHRASHAIALTNSRWIISEDRHERWAQPHVRSIPFANVLTLEKGSALLQAWLSLRYEENGALQHLTILHKAIGNHHFDDAVRTYRRVAKSECAISAGRGESKIWQHIPPYLAQELIPVLVDGEHVHLSTRTTDEWKEERRRWKRVEHCVRPWSAFLMTDHGFLYAESEKSSDRDLWAFGANVWCIPPDELSVSSLEVDESAHVKLVLTRGTVRTDLTIAVPSVSDPVVNALHAQTGYAVTRDALG